MVIGLDARAYGWAGLGRYTRNLLRHLAEGGSHDIVAFVPRAHAREVARLPRTRVVPVTGSYYSVREQTSFLWSLLATRVDLMHFPHFNAPVLYHRPSVVTVHDLTRFLFPAQKHQGLMHQWAYEEVFRAAVMHATRVIAVSEHTRSDLIRFFPDVAGKASVIYEGIELDRYRHEGDASADRATLAQYGIRQPYLLSVGVWMNHKNLARTIEAFGRVRAEEPELTLVMTGRGRPSDEDVPGHVRRVGLSGAVILPGVVPEEDLPSLYRGADVFVFPSLYEGFGFPPLEAMACGTPVVASNVSSLPEVLGTAAEYVDPLSVEDIARGVLRILHDPDYRTALQAAGRAHVGRYRWETCARQTLRVYETVAARVWSPA